MPNGLCEPSGLFLRVQSACNYRHKQETDLLRFCCDKDYDDILPIVHQLESVYLGAPNGQADWAR